jgi:hypothetical protein
MTRPVVRDLTDSGGAAISISGYNCRSANR